jgi:GntR family transcriptional regulator, transcriptional repressor for pyruvate dehydrogenase complex
MVISYHFSAGGEFIFPLIKQRSVRELRMLKPVRHRNIADQVYEQIRDLIYRGELAPGERLMPERDMAVFFKVARPTVRGAIQRLIEQGLIESRRGVGTYVAEKDGGMEKRPLLQVLNKEAFTVVEFQEVRMGLEAISAELAAKRATDEDIRLIRQCLERIKRERIAGHLHMKTDISFHMNIAYASKNIVQIHLMKSFYDVQTFAMALAYEKLFSTLNIDTMIDQQHSAIFQAICNHNPVQARKSMENHIRTVLDLCREHGL